MMLQAADPCGTSYTVMQVVIVVCSTITTVCAAFLSQARYAADKRAEIRHLELRLDTMKQTAELKDNGHAVAVVHGPPTQTK